MSVFDSYFAMQTAALAKAVGIPDDQLPTAVAIAWAESGLQSWKVNSSAGETPKDQQGKRPCASYGLWQINNCPDRDAQNPNRGADNPKVLLDPLTNARAMGAISSGGSNWQPWTTYRSVNGKQPAYLKHMGDAAKAVTELRDPKYADIVTSAAAGGIAKVGGESGGISVGDAWDIVTNPDDVARGIYDNTIGQFDDWMGALQALVRFIVNPTNWLRLLAAWVGFSLVVGGLVLLTLDVTGTTDNAAGAVVGAATGGPAGAAMGAAGA